MLAINCIIIDIVVIFIPPLISTFVPPLHHSLKHRTVLSTAIPPHLPDYQSPSSVIIVLINLSY